MEAVGFMAGVDSTGPRSAIALFHLTTVDMVGSIPTMFIRGVVVSILGSDSKTSNLLKNRDEGQHRLWKIPGPVFLLQFIECCRSINCHDLPSLARQILPNARRVLPIRCAFVQFRNE